MKKALITLITTLIAHTASAGFPGFVGGQPNLPNGVPPMPGPLPFEQVLKAELVDFNVSEKLGMNPTQGSVIVDEKNNKIELVLADHNNYIRCAMAPCPVSKPQARTFKLDIIDVRTDSCGAKIYTAKNDMRPVDGPLSEIVVTDYQFMLCEIAVKNLTSIELTITPARFPAEFHKSHLGGNRLQKVLQ